jgi:hypothetical protein
MAAFDITQPDGTIVHESHQHFACALVWAAADKSQNGDTEFVQLVALMNHMQVGEELRRSDRIWKRIQ